MNLINNYSTTIHTPVLCKEVIEHLCIKPNGTYLDCTAGFAGHSSQIIKKLIDGKLFCFDQDEVAFHYLKKYFAKQNKIVKIFHQNFIEIKQFAQKTFDGIIFDLGVSSLMFDDAKRGFSYRLCGPLDMRMSNQQTLTAKHIVNTYSRQQLIKIFQQYGEVKKPQKVVDAIIKIRNKQPINTTLNLSQIICDNTIGSKIRKHPAKQYFQALRIVVNDELNVLKEALATSLKLLKISGFLLVISFHSLEDRIVKQMFNNVTSYHDLYDRNVPLYQAQKPAYKLINKKPILPSKDEIRMNKRSKSAKLRIIQRIS